MDASIQRLLSMRKFIFWINAHTPIEKQTKQDWNTPIHLKNNGPRIKVSLILWFLIKTFNLCFYRQLWVKWYVYILEIVLSILEKLIYDSQNVCGCLTLNEMHIKLASLIIWSINDNLTNTSSTRLPEVKKQYCI